MSLQERLEIIRSSPAPRGEEQAKFQIIAPILHNLGWDPAGPEVLYELAVGGKGGGRADIALKSSGRVEALIEAKAPGLDLKGHVGQVIGYAFYEGVDICVLTTGLEWWLFLPREKGRPMACRFAVLSIHDDPLEQLVEDFHAFLSKATLVNGEAERRAKAVLEASREAARLNQEIPRIWTDMVRAPDEELVELLSKRIYEQVNLRPTRDQVVAALQGSSVPSAPVPADPSAPTPPAAPTKPTAPGRTPRRSTKPVAMVLWGERHEVQSHVDVLKTVIDRLYERHTSEWDRVLEVRGHKNPYAARDPQMFKPDGRKYNYRHLASGYYFDLWHNADALQRRARQFLVHFGHDPSDLEVLYD